MREQALVALAREAARAIAMAAWERRDAFLTGRRLPLTAVDFPGPEPAFSPAWRAVFCPQLNFEQPVAALYFPAQALHWPLLAPVFAAGEKVDFTFLHDSEKIDRTYSRAILTGDPSVDDITGEVSGITVVAEGYLEVPR